MILDSSAIVAILLREPEHEALRSKLAAYVTAQLAGEPLLCTGNDFSQTDLELA